ncbi:MAG: class I SAM-dependent methyltransferase, partial [Lautropia sp.]
ANRGITAHGIEYNPDMVELAKRNAAAAGVAARATFAKADLFESDFSKAQVITMFLLPSINEKLRPKILDLKPGTRIVSNSFRMGEWEPDQTVTIDNCTSWCTAYLWIVPAKVSGAWRVGQQELKLTQTFQMLTGTLGSTPISAAKVDGNNVTFTAGGVRYRGTVDGASIKGTTSGSSKGNWSAAKI